MQNVIAKKSREADIYNMKYSIIFQLTTYHVTSRQRSFFAFIPDHDRERIGLTS